MFVYMLVQMHEYFTWQNDNRIASLSCLEIAECWHDKYPLHVYFSSTISLMMVKSEHTYTHTGHCIHIKVKKLFAGVTQN